MTTGIFSSTGINTTTDLMAKSFAGQITRLGPNGQAPLFGMTAMLPSETALQIEHGFFTKTMIFPSMTMSASATSSETVLTVTSTTNLLPNMIMRDEATSECVIINAILSATTVSVTRGVGSVAAASIGSSDAFYQVGNAFEESSVRPNALQINPVRVTNYTQIFRNTWAVSGSAAAIQVIAGDSTVAENRMDCASFHAADIEKALFFGQKSQGTRNGQPFRTMDGLINIVSTLANYPSSFAATNVTVAGSTTNYTQLETAFNPVFNQVTDPKVGNQRVIFCGGAAKVVLNNIGRVNATYQIVNGTTTYGLQFGSFNISRGSFNLIEHPLFNSNSTWSKYAVVVDLSTFRLAYLGGRKTMKADFNANGENVDNGIDAIGGTLTTELTCVVKNPPANALMTNLTAAAAG